MLIYVCFFKLFTFILTLFSSLVYNFHKHIKDIKTKHNLKYGKKFNIYHRLDVHYNKNEIENKKPCIVYFHGGGWMCYSKCIYTTLCRRLAKMGYVVFNVNYSLSPKNKMDKILNDCKEAVDFVQKIADNFGGDKNKIIFAGDSAGAHISAMLAGFAKHNKYNNSSLKENIKALILLYGVFDLTTMLQSKFPNIKIYGKNVLKGKCKDIEENNKYSPINYISSEYPPCFVASGKIDKLHESQSNVMFNTLIENNVKAEKLFFEKKEKRAFHAYMIFDGLQTNVKTLEQIEKFLKEVV